MDVVRAVVRRSCSVLVAGVLATLVTRPGKKSVAECGSAQCIAVVVPVHRTPSILSHLHCFRNPSGKKGKGRPYSITERRVSGLIPVIGSQPAGDMSHKPGGRLPLLYARPTVTLATLKRAATNFAAW